MLTRPSSEPHVLDLRVGELVEVRSEPEILATLDENGELEDLPFMPEMLQFCGQRFRVGKLALKLCDTINWTGMYRMRHAVHLQGVRCDGQAHGGCQAGCLVYWKEAWLKRVEADEPDPTAAANLPVRLRLASRSSCHAARASSWSPGPTTTGPPTRQVRRRSPARRPSSSGRRPSVSRPGISGSTCWMSGPATRRRWP